MRMRQLGNGQSLMFFAPFEIDRAMKRAAGKRDSDTLAVIDILRWSMLETCLDIEHHLPHWAHQGLDYVRRKEALEALSSEPSGESLQALVNVWRQPESRSLDQLYGLDRDADGGSDAIFEVPELADHLQNLGIGRLGRVDMDEEQEREVDHEAEVERQIERPPRAKAAEHNVHPDLERLVTQNVLNPSSPAFEPVFKSIPRAPRDVWADSLLVTKDFLTTIQNAVDDASSAINAADFHKPVNWLLSTTIDGRYVVVILSGYEVNKLLPKIRSSRHATLHIYSPKVVQDMQSFEDLRFYCIPNLRPTWTSPNSRILNQLNLFAGQLYLKDYSTYLAVCEFLGLCTEGLKQKIQNVIIRRNRPRSTQGTDQNPSTTGTSNTVSITALADGFVKPIHRVHNLPFTPFTWSPIPFLKEWMTIRRKGQSYMATHMGNILHARELHRNHF
jgi:hypothetical protein